MIFRGKLLEFSRLSVISFYAGVFIGDILYDSAPGILGYFVLRQSDAERERPPENGVVR